MLTPLFLLVYDDKKISLADFNKILLSNWKDNEVLRLTIKNKVPKFGTNHLEVDLIAKDVVEYLSQVVNGRPNVKGGIYRLGTFSINWH